MQILYFPIWLLWINAGATFGTGISETRKHRTGATFGTGATGF